MAPSSDLDLDLFGRAPEKGDPEQVGGDIEQFHFPHFVIDGNNISAYFIDHSGGVENEVGLATSKDGVNFEYRGKVLRRDRWYDRLQATFASVYWAGGKYHMLYEAKADIGDINSVCHADSDDGVNWTKSGPVIRPSCPEADDRMEGVPTPGSSLAPLDVGTPTLQYDGEKWHVYYHATDRKNRVRIGYASGPTLGKLSVQNVPALDLGEGEETGTVGWRSNIVQMGDWHYMAYEWASDPTKNTPNTYEKSRWGTSLARAASPSGPWQKSPHNPLLRNGNIGFGMDGPELAVIRNRLYLYYRWERNTTWRVRLS